MKESKPEIQPILRRFADRVSAHGSDAAIYEVDGRMIRTFSEVDADASTWADRLLSGPGAVGLQMRNSREWPAVLLGAWRAGRPVVLMDVDLVGERRDRVESICGITTRVTAGRGSAELVATGQEAVACGADLLKLTSGTTGEARAIRFSAGQLLADCDQVCDTMGLREDDRNFGVIAFSHSYGFSNLITPLLCRGIPLVVAQDAIPRALLVGLAESRATVFPGVPAHFRTLRGFRPGKGALRLCISAGAPLTSDLAETFSESWGLKLHSFYGASECGGICYDAGEEPGRPDGFVGRPMCGVELLSRGESTGALLATVRSPAVGMGYFPEVDDGTLSEGRFEPSDLLERTADGYVISGRVSDLINVAGKKANPAEIENVIGRCPGVRDVVVFGLPAGLRGEEVVACIVGEISEVQVRVFCRDRLAAWQMPRSWIFREKIPVNARGKVSRKALRELFVDGSM